MYPKSLQLCPTLCNPVDWSPPGSFIHGILQARILEWVAISFSRGSSWPRDWTQVSCISGRRFNLWATRQGRYIPKYFILFVAMVNGIVSLISLSIFSLFVYRGARDFCVLTLYPATLLCSLISSSNFVLWCLWFWYQDNASFVKLV